MCRHAALQNLHSVILVIDPVGHGEACDRTAATDAAIEHAAGYRAEIIDHRAVKRAAGNRAAVSKHGVRVPVSGAAADHHIAADVERSVVKETAAMAVVCAGGCRTAVLNLCRAGQGGAAVTIIADTAAPSSPTFVLRCHRAVGDAAAGHGEYTTANAHTAAVSGLVLRYRRAAGDAAAGHVELTAENEYAAAPGAVARVRGCAADDIAAEHLERAAVNIYTAAFFGFSAVDNAAMDGLCAACAPFPQTIGVRGELICRCGVAVLQRKVTAVCNLDHAAAAGHFQHIADKVKGDGAVNGQGGADCNVIFQCDDVCAAVRQRINKLLFRFNFLVSFAFGKYACRHKAYHHTKGEQYT